MLIYKRTHVQLFLDVVAATFQTYVFVRFLRSLKTAIKIYVMTCTPYNTARYYLAVSIKQKCAIITSRRIISYIHPRAVLNRFSNS